MVNILFSLIGALYLAVSFNGCGVGWHRIAEYVNASDWQEPQVCGWRFKLHLYHYMGRHDQMEGQLEYSVELHKSRAITNAQPLQLDSVVVVRPLTIDGQGQDRLSTFDKEYNPSKAVTAYATKNTFWISEHTDSVVVRLYVTVLNAVGKGVRIDTVDFPLLKNYRRDFHFGE